MKGKVLITEVVHPVLQTELTDFGFECLHLEKATYTDVLAIIDQFTGLVVRSKIKVDRELIDKAQKLRFIGRTGSGMELIDIDYAQQKKITCLNSPEGNRESVAEHATGMLLSLLHNIGKSDAELRRGEWKRLQNTGTELMGKTVGIIGFGNTGTAFAKRLQSFGVKILAYDKYKKGYKQKGVKESSLETIFQQADVLSLHIPLNSETHYWIGKRFLEQFAKPIYLINTSRGAIINIREVLECLETGRLKGLALDVFENEELSSFSSNEYKWYEHLCKKQNVVITPHIAGVTHEATYKLAQVLAQKIIDFYTEKF